MGNRLGPALFSSQLKHPSRNPIGYYVLNYGFPKTNTYLAENAVKLCNIESNHTVLEIGFGTGLGLKAAFPHIKEGSGTLYGIDWSDYVVKRIQTSLRPEIESGKLLVSSDSVMMLPFPDNMFDRVFHTNCYYFWTNMELACSEIYRTMKPHSYMVTCLNIKRIGELTKQGYFSDERPDPIFYMHNLEMAGFKDVEVKYMTCDTTGQEYAAIYAYVREKKLLANVEELAKAELEIEQETRESSLF